MPGVGVSVRHAMSQVKVMPVRHVVVAVMLAAGPFVGGASVASADGSGDPAAGVTAFRHTVPRKVHR